MTDDARLIATETADDVELAAYNGVGLDGGATTEDTGFIDGTIVGVNSPAEVVIGSA